MKRRTDYDYYNTNRNKIIGTNGVQYIGIPALTVRSSESNVSGLKSELILNICKKVQAYHQMKSKEFVPYMSSLDLFMNCGFEEGRKIIMEGNEEVSIN